MKEPGKRIANAGWNLDDVIGYVQATGNADVEEDNYGNIVVYPTLYEDPDGILREGSLGEEDRP